MTANIYLILAMFLSRHSMQLNGLELVAPIGQARGSNPYDVNIKTILCKIMIIYVDKWFGTIFCS
jgi:hypothetical protein